MWLLVVNLCSIFSVRFVDFVQRYVQGEELSQWDMSQAMLAGYARFCILRILFFVGGSFYTVGWEAFSDFPTVRRLLVGRSGADNVPMQASERIVHDAVHRAQSAPYIPFLRMDSETDKVSDASDVGEGVPRLQGYNSFDKNAQNGLRFRGAARPQTNSKDSWTREGSDLSDGWEAPGLYSRLPSFDASAEETPINRRNLEIREWGEVFKAGSHGRKGTGPSSKTPRRRRFFRQTTLVAPLMGLIACALVLALVTALCRPGDGKLAGQFRWCSSPSSGVSSLVNPTGIVNRGTRFALFVAFLQWLGQFLHLFPHWHRGLMATGVGRACGLVAMVLVPACLIRLVQWVFMPAGPGVSRYIFGGLPHHVVDVGLIIVLKLWLLVACIEVLRHPLLSGFERKRRLGADWSEMAVLFKYTFLVPTIMHFVRGVMQFGFAGAQNDLLVIVCVYPLLLVAVWTLVWAVVVAPQRRVLLAGAAGSLALASTICNFAGLRQGAGTVVVFLHLMRQYLKLFGKRRQSSKPQHVEPPEQQVPDDGDHSAEETAGPVNAAAFHATKAGDTSAGGVLPRPVYEARPRRDRSNSVQKRIGNVLIMVAALIAVAFSAVLLSLSVASAIQQKIDWYPNTIWFELEASPPTLRVDHLISRLRLQFRADAASRSSGERTTPFSGKTDPPSSGVSYASCSHEWHGLGVLDYALLSLASYFDPSGVSLSPLLGAIFPEGSGIDWRLRNVTGRTKPRRKGTTSRLSWIEVEVQEPDMERPILVVAIRGTDPVRVSDYLEDIRMWTEPVAMSILSTVFPTVRAWPRRTAEMVIQGIHDLLDSIGVPDDRWSYNELVDHILEVPREQYSQVVLTGHSLGGGMATVVAAITHVPVIAINPPGIYTSIAKHLRTSDRSMDPVDDLSSWMHHQSLSLVVENDWVNGIFDDHGGLVQMMTCDRSEESLQLACHMLEGTICHLFNRCGDMRQRWTACAHEYVLKDQMQSTTLHVLRQMLPEAGRQKLGSFLAWLEQPMPSDLDARSGALWLISAALVVLPLLGGAIEELLLM